MPLECDVIWPLPSAQSAPARATTKKQAARRRLKVHRARERCVVNTQR
jgi:hypothetical protein